MQTKNSTLDGANGSNEPKDKTKKVVKVVEKPEFKDYNEVIKKAQILGKREIELYGTPREKYQLVEAAINELVKARKISEDYTRYSFYTDFAKKAALIFCDLSLCAESEKNLLNLRSIAFNAAWSNNAKVDGKVVDHVFELICEGLSKRDFHKEGWDIKTEDFNFFDEKGEEDKKVLVMIQDLPKIKRILDLIGNDNNPILSLKNWKNAVGSAEVSQATEVA